MADPETDNQQEDGRPEWLPENFKSPEDLVGSYKEAQRKITEESTARQNLESAYMELQQQVEDLQAQANTPQVNPATAQEAWYQQFEQDPLQSIYQLANAVADQKLAAFQQQVQAPGDQYAQALQENVAAMADRDLGNSIPDWGEYREKVGQYIQEHPWVIRQESTLSPVELAGQLQEVYKAVKYEDLSQGTQQQAEQLAEMKRQAQTLSGSGGRPPVSDDEKAAWEKIRSAGTQSYWQNLK